VALRLALGAERHLGKGVRTLLPDGGEEVSIDALIAEAHGLYHYEHPFRELFYTEGGIPEHYFPVMTGPFAISTFDDPKGRVLLPIVQEKVEALKVSEAEKAARGERAIYEDFRREILGLTIRTTPEGTPELVLRTGPTNYFTIRTLEDLRMHHGRDYLSSVTRFFQNYWGMSTLVEAQGDNGPVLVFSKRSGAVALYKNCYNATASGMVEQQDFQGDQIDLRRIATRELKEETGIRLTEGDTFEVLGLGYNIEKSDWNLQMLVRTGQDVKEILANRGSAPDRWETDDLFVVDASHPESVLEALKARKGLWTPNGASSVYIYLCRRFGIDVVTLAS
jgi:8-oxo-dGTP pyrophosphatase MutT (NUDIX family)